MNTRTRTTLYTQCRRLSLVSLLTCLGGLVILSSFRLPSFEFLQNVFSRNTNDNMTVVTAYFNLGSFQKGEGNLTFTSNTYHQWIATFQYLVNPVVFYTDSQKFADLMKEQRIHLKRKTVIKIIDRNELWAFQLKTRIQEVYSKPDYPQHHPNTVIPEYSCAQHAKYSVLEKAIKSNYFNTKYYTWLDVGYFRDEVNSTEWFRLNEPPDFNDTKIAVNEVYEPTMDIEIEDIFLNNEVWVGGGMIAGETRVLINFIREYRNAVGYFLSKDLMNTDQQILYGMYCDKGREILKPNISLQIYSKEEEEEGNIWFYLGYISTEVLDTYQ